MQLGALMRRLEDAADAAQAMDALGDVVLFSRVQAAGQRYDETPGAYLAGAARRFATLGSDDDWLALMTALERAEDPARAIIGTMLQWALDKDAGADAATACSPVSGAGGHHEHG